MAKTQGAPNMTIKFFPNDKGNPPGKLADAELHFSGGPLDGLKLIGFAIWERRRRADVTFPARQYTVNGERRSFALLRPSRGRVGAGSRARSDSRRLQGARAGGRRVVNSAGAPRHVRGAPFCAPNPILPHKLPAAGRPPRSLLTDRRAAASSCSCNGIAHEE